jgi:uncharacterized protein YhfF
MQFDAKTDALWQAYLVSLPHAEDARPRLFEVFRIGNSPERADTGAALIKQGLKTASSLLWAYEATNKPLPEVGSLSIVTDSRGDPVSVTETLAVDVKAFADVDESFAYDYGEWDRTPETWTARCWELNASRCQALGKMPTPEMPLVCERFAVVYPITSLNDERNAGHHWFGRDG